MPTPPKKSRTPQPGSAVPKKARPKPGMAARQERIARAVVAGKPIKQIAQEEQLSRVHAGRLAQSEAVMQRIAQLVDSRPAEMAELFDLTTRVIRDAMEAKDYKALLLRIKRKEGKDAHTPTEDEFDLDSPPDHYARLAAAKRFIELVSAGRPPARADEKERRPVTLEELGALLTLQAGQEDIP